MDEEMLISLLKEEVKPALGCTEPGAVALAAARASRILGGEIEKVEARVSPGVFKNAMRVTIPNTDEKGLIMAAALGAVLAEPERGLELFDRLSAADLEAARCLVAQGQVKVALEKTTEFFIRARVEGSRGWAEVEVAGGHTNITRVVVNGEDVSTGNAVNSAAKVRDITNFAIKEFVSFIETVPLGDISFLETGVKMNLLIAEKGLELKSGLGLGHGFQLLMSQGCIGDDLLTRARMMVAAACDARMAGVNLPVMTTMGSGNQGLGASIPVIIVAQELGLTMERMIRALALSYIVTAYVKQQTGKLSPVCGCSIAAGVGAAGAINWMIGGDIVQIGGAIKNMIGNLTGMICDGAKGGCALKLSTSAAEAVMAAFLARQGVIVEAKDGIVSATAEESVRNLQAISIPGMTDTDEIILQIMLEESKAGACELI
ncbi:MAG: L-serine ammonia-lyase, iron-sulfur-dependent, subunit alpha [Negativicutes bacterium]|nr:L-serine ammonia-lyase, iron-sulfur-dependent, subunit alpha [Negativicutes bacterium]